MNPGLRKLALAVHLTVSVGWIGAVVGFLALVIPAMTSQDAQRLRAAWIAMELTGRLAIVPLALASLLTGLIMALGTKWGLFRHYWVSISFVLTVIATAVLLGNMQAVSFFAGIAARADGADLDALRGGLKSELLHAGVGLVLLLVILVLNVYKPRGMTAYGRRRQHEARAARQPLSAPGGGMTGQSRDAGPDDPSDRQPGEEAGERRGGGPTEGTPRWLKVLVITAVILIMLFVLLHLAGRGTRGHGLPASAPASGSEQP